MVFSVKTGACLVCLVLLSAFLPSIGRSVEIQEPQNIYFYRSDCNDDDYDPAVAWNRAKEMPELLELANYGNYSVLSAFVVNGVEDKLPSHGDYFIIASTLQPDNEGLIHQLMVRFRRNYSFTNSTYVWSVVHIETYVEIYSFNPITVEEAESKVDEFGCGCFDPLYGRRTYLNHPFLIFRRQWVEPFFPLPVSIILNELTGKILVISEFYEPGGILCAVLSHNPEINPTSDTVNVTFTVIITALPAAYNAKPGDRFWCLYLDANRDNIIDIYDALAFAKNR